MVETIEQNLLRVNANIAEAALKSGRQPEDVHLVVVTKGQPVEIIETAIEAGASILGENYVQETQAKQAILKATKSIEWHMIGHVQRRKSNLVIQLFQMVHSVDSIGLAERLDEQAKRHEVLMPILFEINLGGEDTKFGWRLSEGMDWRLLAGEIDAIQSFKNLEIRGLMTMPPFFLEPEATRPFYRRLRELRDRLTEHIPGTSLKDLSMGTSVDYPVAVQEGATYVRVGQAILGPRS